MIEQLELRSYLSYAAVGFDDNVQPYDRASGADVAISRNGGYVVLTNSNYKRAQYLRLSRYRADGRPIDDNPLTIHVMSHEQPIAIPMSIATDADGDSVAVYQGFDSSRTTVSIRARRISRSGVVSDDAVVGSLTIPQKSPRTVTLPVVAMDDSGRYLVGWLQSDGAAGNTLHFRAFNADGTPRAAGFTVPTFDVGDQKIDTLDLAMSNDGSHASFAYGTRFSKNRDTSIFVGRINATGTVGGLTRIRDNAVFAPSISVYEDGTAVVAYERRPDTSVTDESKFDSRVQRFGTNGVASGKAITLGVEFGNSGKGVVAPSVSRLGDGGFVVAYRKGQANYSQRYLASGASDDDGPVDLNSEDLVAPTIAANPDGMAAAVWLQGGSGTPGEDYLVHNQELTTGIIGWSGDLLEVLGTMHSEAISVKERGGSLFVAVGDRDVKIPKSRADRVRIHAYNGNDRVENLSSLSAEIIGGRGNDTIDSGSASGRVNGELGNDSITGGSLDDILRGGGGDDVITGNDGDDFVEGGDGNDRVFGNAGNDELHGENGNDTLFGAAGDDVIFGDAGNDQLSGDDGNDYIDAGPGRDSANGGNGDDRVLGGDSGDIDTLFGGAGTDMLHGNARDRADEFEDLF